LPYCFDTSAFVCGVWPLSEDVQLTPEEDIPVVQCVQCVVPLAGLTPGDELDAFAACFAWPGELDDGCAWVGAACFFAWPGA
jgi:hypothetical protein